MTLEEYYRTYSSDTTAGSANQNRNHFDKIQDRVGRCCFKLSHGGENYSLLFSNQIDSTFDDGKKSWANIICDDWTIKKIRVGLTKEVGTEPEKWFTVTFDGKTERLVTGPQPFFTDPIPLNAKPDDYLAYEITFIGDNFPAFYEVNLENSISPNEENRSDGQFPQPLMIGSDRPVTRKIGFMGDSITQGIGTPFDSYTHYVAEIAKKLPDEWSVWNLGIGFARAQDAATDNAWLARAKHCDTVNVCFGVNDLFQGRSAEQIKNDLKKIVRLLKEAGCRVILFTVPPFNYQGDILAAWRDINNAIYNEIGKEADQVFNFGSSVCRPAPEDNMCVYGSHPNSEGCMRIALSYINEGILI